MKLIKRTLVHLTVILVLISLTSQFRIKRQEGPSETDNAEPLDESLRTDHLPLHDETELAVVENDVSLTPDDQIVESTPPNNEFLSKPDDESESGSESSSLESSTIEENMTNSNSQSTESEMISESQSEETNTYLQDEALETQQVDTTEVNSLSETDFPETTVPTSSTETQESEATNVSETSETNEVFKDTVQTAETTVESENIELIEETTQLAETTVEPKNTEEIDSLEVDETTESYTENEELKETTVTPKDETTQVVSETHATTSENTFEKAVEATTTEDSTENETTQAFEEVTEKKNEEQTEQLSTEEAEHDHPTLHNNHEQFIENPSDDQLLESNKIANDYEDEITTTKSPTTKPNVWFKPTKSMRINDSYDDESHITANCPSLNCEFGYKTDLYGKPICACFNPCHEKKCGDHVCKIEKLSETKFIGACYDPRKIERPLYCHLPLATGTCKNYTSRFYFNSFMQKCSHFVYTGCGGNQNNFDTWEKCEMECNTCSLPAVRGPCKGNIIRYHYDLMKRECVAFNWGGCKGNENNFQTRKHCEDSCIFRKEGALFLHGMPVRMIRKYHQKEKN